MSIESTTEPLAEPADGLAAREAALALVAAALDHRGGLEEAMDRAPFDRLELRDRALARMIAMTLLRRLGSIDRLLTPRLRKPPPEPVLMLLRLGVVQAFYLDTPSFAAVDTTVRLAGRDKATQPFKNLINAVLRGLLRDPAPAEDDPETLAPGWIFTRWSAAYGETAARAIAAQIVREPATDLSLRDPADAATLAPTLEAEALPGGSLRVRHRGDVAAWSGYGEGLWWVQDAAAAIPARLLATKAGETVLDICAAPGGKTLQLAASSARVTALDRSAPRLKRLAQALERTGLTAEIVTADIAKWNDARQFDAVLIERVLVNLLENVSKYTPSGSTVTLSAQVIGDQLSVSVADNGPGLPAGREEAVFQKFTRGERESSTPGVGLGLAICRAIIESHQGKITASPRPGGGAIFTFTLPLGLPPPALEPETQAHDG